MSNYTSVEANNRVGQVKCWGDDLKTYRVGDKVPRVGNQITYAIAMREGGYLHVVHLIFVCWDEEPGGAPIYDKWGDWMGSVEKTRGLLGEPYLFERRKK